MATAVGSSAALSTWGKFRHVWSYKFPSDFEGGGHYSYFPNGLKSAAAGSGLIRGLPWGGFVPGVELFNQGFTTGTTPPFPFGNEMVASPLTGYATLETQAELTGETVTFQDFRTGVIPASFWTTGKYIWSPATIGNTFAGDEIEGITKLQRF